SGVPRKSRTCGHADGKLIGSLRARESTRTLNGWTPTRALPFPNRPEGGSRRFPHRTRPFASAPMNEVTQILSDLPRGDARAAGQLLPLVYDELRRLAAARLAAEPSGNTLQPTALVHEAYLRLVGTPDGDRWDHRGHFFAAAAEAMRRILV